jgi:alkylated DNA nucleotide flippase Atl1
LGTSAASEVASLRQELADIKGLIGNPEAVEHLHQTLHQTEDGKAALKRQIAGLREVQLEMERQRDRDRLQRELSDIHAQPER